MTNHPRRTTRLSRPLITEAARELFSTQGYAETSIEDIAGRLAVRKGAVYYHVPRKADLLIEVIAELMRPIAARAEEIAQEDTPPWQQLSDLVHSHVDHLLANQQAARVFFEQFRDIPSDHTEFTELARQIETAFGTILDRGASSGDFRSTPSPFLRRHVLALCNWPYRWYVPDGPHSRDEIVESVWAHVVLLVRSEATDGPPPRGPRS